MIKINSWRPWYLLFSICYICWMVNLGTNDFKKIHQDYRKARFQLKFDQVEKSAIRELTANALKNQPKDRKNKTYVSLILPK